MTGKEGGPRLTSDRGGAPVFCELGVARAGEPAQIQLRANQAWNP